MQQLTCEMVWSFSFFLKKRLDFKRKSWGKKCGKVRKSVEKCEKVPKRCCPLVVALEFSLITIQHLHAPSSELFWPLTLRLASVQRRFSANLAPFSVCFASI